MRKLVLILFVLFSCGNVWGPLEADGLITSFEWVDGWEDDHVILNDESRFAIVEIEIDKADLFETWEFEFDLIVDGLWTHYSITEYFGPGEEIKTMVQYDSGFFSDKLIPTDLRIENACYHRHYGGMYAKF